MINFVILCCIGAGVAIFLVIGIRVCLWICSLDDTGFEF